MSNCNLAPQDLSTDTAPTCSFCGRLFARKCHVRRHEATHTGLKHPCQFCGKRFARSDVARRHAQSCSSRAHHEPLHKAKRGRKPHACDRCSRHKIACGTQRPCMRCLQDGLPCISAGSSVSSLPESNDKHKSLLLAMTDPKLPSAATVFASEEPCLNRKIRYNLEQYAPHNSQTFGNSGSDIPFWGFEDPLRDLLLDDLRYRSSALLPNERPTSKLELRLNQLTTELREFCTSGSSSRQELTFVDANYTTVFSVQGFLSLVGLFFQRRHSQWPILHWPTFNLEKVALPLLLAVALSGAAFSRPEDAVEVDPIFAKSFYQTAEAYIFHHLDVLGLPADCTRSVLRDDAMEICQAALLMEVLQKSVNDIEIRQRMLTKRHPALVAAVRSLGILGTRHRDCTREPTWELFIQTELRIRLVAWTFHADALPPLFYNQPPSMMLSEMTGDLPCDEELWSTETEASFKEKWRGTNTIFLPHLQRLVTDLLDDSGKDKRSRYQSGLSGNHLNMVILALQPVIFNLRTILPIQSVLSMTLRALQRWWSAWDSLPQNQKFGIGRHAPEFAILTRKILEAGQENNDRFTAYLSGLVHEDTEKLHEFIKDGVAEAINIYNSK